MSNLTPSPSGSDNIAEAKRRLPLKQFMAQLGHGDAAKTKARCPFHNDESASFSVYVGDDGEERWKCHAGCSGSDAIDFLAKVRGLTNAEACREFIRMAGVAPIKSESITAPTARSSKSATPSDQTPFDWKSCCEAFDENEMQKLAAWRGFSIEFVRWLHLKDVIGIFEGKIAFANHGDNRKVVSAHVRIKSDLWLFKPTGQRAALLIFGDPKTASSTLVFESQWDAFAVMDKLGWHSSNGLRGTAVLITRSASNGKFIRGQLAPGSICYAFKQNDKPTPKKPIPAADIWLADIASNAGHKVFNVATPSIYNDANDWTRAGVTPAELETAMREAVLVESVLKTESAVAPISSSESPMESVQTIVPTLIERVNARMYSPTTEYIKPIPRYSVAGIGICTGGNLTTIGAPPKVGKSALVNAMIACTFSEPGADCFGFISRNPDGHAVLHIDTEQSQFDHAEGIRCAILRAKVEGVPAWFRSYCLTGFTANDIRDAIPILLKQSVAQFGGVHSVFIDGIADATPDVNDPAETSSLVGRFHQLAIEFDCPMLFIIHYNPGSEKTRGHLGSHLERKSETNLRLEKDKTGVTKLWADKNRRAPISKETGPRFAWSDEAEMHVSVPSNWTQKGHDKSNRLRAEAVTVFAVNTDSAISHGELVGRLKAELDVSVSTAKRRFNEMLEAEIIRKQGMGYSLN